MLVLQFSGKSAAAAGFVAGLAVVAYALFDGRVVDGRLLGYLQAGAGVLGVASKAPQIWTVWRTGGTGQLSAFAVGFWPFFREQDDVEIGLRKGGWLTC